VILDLLTVKFLLSYSTRPLQIFGLIGIAMGLLDRRPSAGCVLEAVGRVDRQPAAAAFRASF
jgi:hypothetical protein